MVGAVVENEHVTVVQKSGIMLVGDLSRSPFPAKFTAGPVHDSHGAGLTKADQQVSIGGHIERVLVSPFIAVF